MGCSLPRTERQYRQSIPGLRAAVARAAAALNFIEGTRPPCPLPQPHDKSKPIAATPATPPDPARPRAKQPPPPTPDALASSQPAPACPPPKRQTTPPSVPASSPVSSPRAQSKNPSPFRSSAPTGVSAPATAPKQPSRSSKTNPIQASEVSIGPAWPPATRSSVACTDSANSRPSAASALRLPTRRAPCRTNPISRTRSPPGKNRPAFILIKIRLPPAPALAKPHL
ncbi:MAG: hypothetical protein JWN34_5366 [Bryobacterales bacterium]|nr:hypothetical protein [Bryobacterales bacterium]